MGQKNSVTKNRIESPGSNKNKTWWGQGVRFACQGSGQCCLSRGSYGYVFLSLEDRRNLAQFLGLRTTAFTRKYCDQLHGLYHLKEEKSRLECIFLSGARCTVYEARPTQCRTWPFWPEVMGAKSWNREVANFCPGVGKGKVIPPSQIKQALDMQKKSEDALQTEALQRNKLPRKKKY
ncbi:MAG: zinc/iron-chelating domain-containing protein [Bdellovibrio sp.]|nr:MAG: zinc/iron-chelating domain-containing protein [Bdellovibrio sp.]